MTWVTACFCGQVLRTVQSTPKPAVYGHIIDSMTLRKYQKVETQDVLTPAQHDSVGEQLRHLGKTSASELTDAERESLRIDLSDSK